MTPTIKYSLYFCLGYLFFTSFTITAQVPVREEPMHRMVIQNQYIRLLDVWIEPGDTTLFHIHKTPSLFVYFSNTAIATQVKGEEWIKEQTTAGKAWYRSFSPDKLVHRVCNTDTAPLHVVDVELVSMYNSKEDLLHDIPLPFPVLFENEKVIAYRLTNSTFNHQNFLGRGPIIAELVSGDGVVFQNVFMNQSEEIKAGQFIFIDPGISFFIIAPETGEINMVLFELK